MRFKQFFIALFTVGFLHGCLAKKLPEQRCFEGGKCVSYLEETRTFDTRFGEKTAVVNWSLTLIPTAPPEEWENDLEIRKAIRQMNLTKMEYFVSSCVMRGLPDERDISNLSEWEAGKRQIASELEKADLRFTWDGTIRVRFKTLGGDPVIKKEALYMFKQPGTH